MRAPAFPCVLIAVPPSFYSTQRQQGRWQMNFYSVYSALALAAVTSSCCNLLGRAGPGPDRGFWEPSSTAPMGLSTYLMPPVNELASHSHRSVLRCINIPCAIGTALLALPTGLPISRGVWRVGMWKEITFQECKDYSLRSPRENTIWKCTDLCLCYKILNQTLMSIKWIMIHIFLNTLGKTCICGHH